MVVASSSAPTALTRVGAAAAGVTLGVVVVLIALPNLRRPGWFSGDLVAPLALLLITLAALCWWVTSH